MELDDQKLVQRVLAGRTDDFCVLVERHQQRVFRFALGLLSNREEAEDVTQEVFLAAFAKLSGYDASRAAFGTWLLTMARNRGVNLLRRRRPLGLTEPDLVHDATAPDRVAAQEFRQRFDQALAELPLEQRSAFVLAEIEQLSYAEIARIERASLGAVKSRIHRAKRRLRSLLEPVVRESE